MGFSFELIIITAMLMINAVFAAYEMALASISRAKLMALVNVKRLGAQEALLMKDRMEGSLAVVQLGITLVGAIAAAVGGAGADEYFSPWLKSNWGLSEDMAQAVSLILLIIPLSCLTIIFAELIPKTFAIKHQVRVCLMLSPLMKILAFIVYPIVSILESVVKKVMQVLDRKVGQAEESTGLHELNAAVALARTSRLLGVQQEKIVLSAAQLSRRTIKEIILPITEVSMIPLTASLSQALIQAHNDMHTRFPVCEQEANPQTITGYVNFKDIVAALKINPSDPSVKGIVRPIKTVPETLAIAQVLERMIEERLHITLVAAADGSLIGMVTLEDIIEELVGEIEDEFDRIPAYVHPYGAGWIIGAGVSMDVFAKTVQTWPALSTQEEKMRLADWFGQRFASSLKGGETVEVNGFQIMVRKLRRKKLGEAIVIKP